MDNLPSDQIRSMLRHGFSGMGKLLVLGVVLGIITFIILKSGSFRDIALRIAIALPFIGFLRGLRVYEYSIRFSPWKDYLAGKATLSKAFASIANRKLWMYMIPAAYFCGIVIGIIFYFVVPFKQRMGGLVFTPFSPVTYLLSTPACAVLLLYGANIFGPKPDEEEELALDVVEILNQSPRISPMGVDSPVAIERFIKGAKTGKGLDVKPYLWILSNIRPPQTMEVFRSALTNSDSVVRQMAVTYLGRIGGANALQLLQEQLPDETDPKIKKLIEENIERLSRKQNI